EQLSHLLSIPTHLATQSLAVHPLKFHSFPTRRSSDLDGGIPPAPSRTRSPWETGHREAVRGPGRSRASRPARRRRRAGREARDRTEEDTSELHSHFDLVCALLLEKKDIAHAARGNGRS